MQHYGYHDNKDQLLKRLKRVEGQMRGIARMIETDKYCIDILTQVSAAEAALDKVALELLREHTRYCLVNGALDHNERNARVDEVVDAVARLLSK